MKLSRVGIDLAKNVYQLHGVDRSGKTILKRRLKRHQWFKVLLDKTEPGCVIGMEACSSAHHWGRELQSPRLHGQVDSTAVREAVREEQQERCQGCRGDL